MEKQNRILEKLETQRIRGNKDSKSRIKSRQSDLRVKEIMNKSASVRVKVYQRDTELLEKRLAKLNDGNSLPKLEKSIANKNQILKELEKQNKRMKRSTSSLRNTIRTFNMKDEVKELTYYKIQNDHLLERIEKNKKNVQELDLEYHKLITEYRDLKSNANLEPEDNEHDEKSQEFEQLKRQVKILTRSLKSNKEKYNREIKALEEQLKKLEQEEMQNKLELMKKKQQVRLLDLKQIEDTRGNLTPGVDFIYKPSIKKLYY